MGWLLVSPWGFSPDQTTAWEHRAKISAYIPARAAILAAARPQRSLRASSCATAIQHRAARITITPMGRRTLPRAITPPARAARGRESSSRFSRSQTAR